MSNHLLEQRAKNEVLFLEAAYAHMPDKGKEYVIAAKELAKGVPFIGATGARATNYAQVFEILGLIKRRYTIEPVVGRQAHWSRSMDLEEAKAVLEKEHADRANPKRKKPTARDQQAMKIDPAPQREPAGPRMEHAHQLIEDARAYARQHEIAYAKLDALTQQMHALGVAFDEDKARAAFVFENDDVLEAVLTVLPVITDLEAQVAELTAQLKEAKRPALKPATMTNTKTVYATN